MQHLYSSHHSPKTTFVFVKHPSARSVVFGFFRHEYPKVPDCRLMGVRINVVVKIAGKKIVLPFIRDFVAWVRTAGVWGYCHHKKRDRKEIHYWLCKMATAENAFEFVVHEVAHGCGFRSEQMAMKIAGLSGFAMTAYKEHFESHILENEKAVRGPCRHCGSTLLGIGWGTEKIKGGRDYCSVKCRRCFAQGPRSENEKEAWAGWNSSR